MTSILDKPPDPSSKSFPSWLDRLFRAVLFASPVERTAAPAVTDDRTIGFKTGSIVVDTAADEVYICVDSSPGAAVWLDVSSGALGAGPVVLNRTGGEGIVQNTTTETAIYSYTIPGGTLGSSRGVWLQLAGAYTNTTGAGRTFTLRVKLGGSTYYADVTPSIASGSPERIWELGLTLKNMNSVSTNRLHGRFELADAGTVTTGLGDLSTAKLIDKIISAAGAAPNVDMSSDRLLEITVQHSNADTAFYTHWGILTLL